MINGVWANYTPYKTFTISAAKPGFWQGVGIELYVTNTTAKVDNFAIYIYVSGCGSYKITHTPLVSVVNKRFTFTGPFYATGTFNTLTAAGGQTGLKSFPLSGCGSVSGGPFSWTARWKNNNQPAALDMSLDVNLMSLDDWLINFIPALDTFLQPFTVEQISP